MGTSVNFANIFTEPNFQGEVKYVTRTGWYVIRNQFTSFDDNISSLTTSVLNNVRVILFTEPDFSGAEYAVENDLVRLPANMDNKCSSMIVELNTEEHVQVFESENYGGFSRTLYGTSYSRLSQFLMHNRISSIKVPFGTEVHLFENENMRGKKIIIDKDTPFIGSDINNKVSSLRILNFPIAYSDPNFKGRSETLEFATFYTADSQISGSRLLKLGNDSIRSLKVRYPFMVKAFAENYLKGDCTVYRYDVEKISPNISSLEVELSSLS